MHLVHSRANSLTAKQKKRYFKTKRVVSLVSAFLGCQAGVLFLFDIMQRQPTQRPSRLPIQVTTKYKL